ncbi:O-antigen ligase family protein [Psychrobacillus psychrotolerans]|uniref:O-antigen ligase family protein n=1 Tax=Psychrobacillus TaxID=1221880 RepID=UPI0033155EDC
MVNFKNTSQFFRPAFIIGLLSFIPINIPMPISDNGKMEVYLIELFLPVLFFYICSLILKKKYLMSVLVKYLFYLVLVFIVYYFFISIYRYINGYEIKQSLLALRTTLPPLIILLLIDSKIIKIKELLIDLILLNLLINIIQLFNIDILRMSPFMGNIMVYLSVILLLLPLNFYILLENKSFKYSKIISLIAIFNITIALIFPALGGSRIAFYLACGVFLVCMIVYSFINKKLFSRAIISLMIAVTFLSIIWYTNPQGMSFGLYRLFPMDVEQVLVPDDIHNKSELTEKQKNKLKIIDETVQVMQQETTASNDIRSYLWEKSIDEILESPLLGKGTIYFEFPNNYNVTQQAAHNFILEYTNAYGIIGLIIFLSFIFVTVLYTTRYNFNIKDTRKNIIKFNLIMSIGIMFAISLFQPTMLIISPVIFFWLIISLNYGLITD